MSMMIKYAKRVFRRATVAGVDFILDHEIAALQALSGSLMENQKEMLLAQLERYDRIDRAPNMRRQRFIDDDSDFLRKDWPSKIIFSNVELSHSADIVLHHRNDDALSVRAQAFLVHGRFDGFEFKFSKVREMNPKKYAINGAMPEVLKVNTNWAIDRVQLFVPFGPEESSYSFVPVE